MKKYRESKIFGKKIWIVAVIGAMEVFYCNYILNDYTVEQLSVADGYIWNQRVYFFSYYVSFIQLITLYFALKQNFNVNNCIRYGKWERVWKKNVIDNLFISAKISFILVLTIFIVFLIQTKEIINFEKRDSIFSFCTYGGIIPDTKEIFLRIVVCFFMISLIGLFFIGMCYIISYWITDRAVFSFIFSYVVQLFVFKYNLMKMDIDYISWYKGKTHISYYILIFLILILFCGYKTCHRKELLNAKNRNS